MPFASIAQFSRAAVLFRTGVSMRFATRLPLVLLLAAAACTKAKLDDAVPNGIVVTADQASISADSGTVTVRAQVFEDSVVLKSQQVTFTVSGLTGGSTVTATTSSSNGFAVATISGLTHAGSGAIVATVGVSPATISSSAPISVLHGAPSSVTLTAGAGSQSISADAGSVTFTTATTDAHGNAIGDATVGVSVNANG